MYQENEPYLNKLSRKFRSAFMRHIQSHFPRYYHSSYKSLAIVMPLALKDIDQAHRALNGLKRYLQHPISKIYIPAQSNLRIAEFCYKNGYNYLDENEVLPESVLNFAYRFDGKNRNGWIRQQFLKLLCFDYIEENNALICDSDTSYIRPIAFFEDNRPVFYLSDEYVPTYNIMNKILLGNHKIDRYSFVSHAMLFERHVVQKLKYQVEKILQKDFITGILEKIDTSISESFSEYQLYGNFYKNFIERPCVRKYWFNKKVYNLDEQEFLIASKNYSQFNSLSSHIH